MLQVRLRYLWVLCLAFVLPLCFVTIVSAADPIADADFNDGAMHWSISADNVLTISGTGDMPVYSNSNNAPWFAYRSQVNSIVVEEGVTGIGAYAFYGLSSAETVSLPDSLDSLGARCFYECGSLKTIAIPEGVDSIPDYAFSYCSSLESIDLPDSVRTFGEYTFYSCGSLESISIPEGVTSLKSRFLFGDCYSMSSITLPSTLTTMGDGWRMFNNTNIVNIYFNGTLSQWLAIQFVDDSYSLPMTRAFNLYIQGEKLSNLIIPTDVTSVPDYAFQYINLNSVTFSDCVKKIGENAFYGSSVASVRMYDSVTSVGTNAFANCASLKKVFFIGEESKWSSIAFNSGNDNLIDAERAFVSPSEADIHTVSVGNAENGTVTVSDSYCLPGDVITVTATSALGYRLAAIKVNGAAIEGSSFIAEADTDYVVTAEFVFYKNVIDHGTCGSDLVWMLYEDNELEISGTGEMSSAYNDPPWYNYRGIVESIVIDEGVTSIRSNAFNGFRQIESITLPDSIERIGNFAFQNCSSLTTVELSKGLCYVGYYAFGSCSLDSVYYSGDVSEWLRIEFDHWTGLQNNTEKLYISDALVEDLIVPQGVSRIPDYTFYGYKGLRSITLQDGLQTIGRSAFGECSELESVVLPNSLRTIGQSAFIGCGSLESIVFPESVESIDGDAFYSCGLTFAEFMGNAPNVGNNAFANNYDVVLYYHAGKTGWSSPKWNDYYAACVEAYSEYSALDTDNRNSQGILFKLNETAKTATVGDGSSSNNNAGYYGSQKGAVVIPNTVTKDGTVYRVIGIGPKAFSHNKHVTSVSIGSGVTSIIPSAFMACPALEAITVSAENEYYSATDGVLYDIEGLYLYVYPGGKTDASFVVPDTVKTIGQYAFYDNENLNSLTAGSNVTAIYRQAFCGLSNLGEITLPFIGTREKKVDEDTYYYYDESFASVFGDGYYQKNALKENYYYNDFGRVYTGGSLKKVAIIGGTIYDSAFSGCGSIEEISLATIPDSVPYSCFSNCTALRKITFAGHSCEIGELVLPNGIESIGERAFCGCKGITSVTIPASLTSVSSNAFSGSGLEKFFVAAGNQDYSTDQWGVLYNIDKTELVQYPSCRKWPYYNVADTTEYIGNQAFSGCEKLVNLYVPKSVTEINRGAISDCPYLTLCCYLNSTASRYALDNSLTAWYMDNKTLQGIRVYSLPEQTVQTMDQVDLQGLYVVGNYQGKELQIDDYTVSYDKSASGLKTVTVEFQGKTVTFEIVLYTYDDGNIIRFTCVEDLDGKTVLAAVYDKDGKMLWTGKATIADGEASVGVSDSVYRNAYSAKLFILDAESFAPTVDVQRVSVGT